MVVSPSLIRNCIAVLSMAERNLSNVRLVAGTVIITP
jgi:hypothetical protein